VKGVTGQRTTLGTTEAVKGSQTSGTIPQLSTIITSPSTLVEILSSETLPVSSSSATATTPTTPVAIMTSETVPVSSSSSTGTSLKTTPLTTTKPGDMTTYIITVI